MKLPSPPTTLAFLLKEEVRAYVAGPGQGNHDPGAGNTEPSLTLLPR
jgi:hypothetical protein